MSMESRPPFDVEDLYLTHRQHWHNQRAIRDHFKCIETRLDQQFDEVNTNVNMMRQQMAQIQEGITNMQHRHRHSSSSRSSCH
jgi:phage shock protein A